MLTVRPISPQSLGYYDLENSRDASNEVSYYEEEAKGLGQWFGKGCQAFGLTGEVDSAQYRNVFNGFSPTRTVALVQNAGRTEGQRARRPGFDFTFSAPKDFSILFAATTSEQERDRLLASHQDAVVFVLDMVEDDLAKCRMGKGGSQIVPAEGLLAALFLHYSSRENDPQLHTHALIANLGQGPDQRWRALASTLAFKPGFMKKYGTLYREILASNLEREFGLEVNLAHGYVRIPGIPAETKAYYSKRRAQIESIGYRDAREASRVAIQTRKSKDATISLGALSATWRQELAKAFGPDFTVEKLSVSQSPSLRQDSASQLHEPDTSPTPEPAPQPPNATRERSTIESPEGSRRRPRTHRATAKQRPLRSLRSLLNAIRSPVLSPIAVPLETSLRRLSSRERFRIRHIAATHGEKKLGHVSPRELKALTAVYRLSDIRLLALTRTSRDASALIKSGTRSIAAIALLRMLGSSPLERALYNVSSKSLTKAFRRGLPDAIPSLLGRRRTLFRARHPILDRKTVLLIDRGALSSTELDQLRAKAEKAGARILLGDLPKPARTEELRLDISSQRQQDLSSDQVLSHF